MFSRNTIAAMIGGIALGAGVAVATTSNGQEGGARTVLIQQPSQPAPTNAPAAPKAPAAPPSDLHVTALAADTFVTVKDHGDAQTVSIFKIDQKGVNHLTHKAKYFY